jgi:hypothetical protein
MTELDTAFEAFLKSRRCPWWMPFRTKLYEAFGRGFLDGFQAATQYNREHWRTLLEEEIERKSR